MSTECKEHFSYSAVTAYQLCKKTKQNSLFGSFKYNLKAQTSNLTSRVAELVCSPQRSSKKLNLCVYDDIRLKSSSATLLARFEV